MAARPRVSVILTSYNHADYLRESIDSVLSQTFPDFELIIWDDASSDASWNIIQSYSDPRIRAYRNETNRGSGNINEAISKVATGTYVAIHHSDDAWEPQKLEKQVRFLDENPDIGAVFTHVMIVGEAGEPIEDPSHPYYSVFDQPNRNRYEWLNFFFLHGNALCHPSVLLRRACYDDCGLYRMGLHQLDDFDMWVRLCLKYEIHIIPEKLIRFRVRADQANVSGDRPETHIRAEFEFLETYELYKGITRPEELERVFPTAKQYFGEAGFDLGYALGRTAFELGTSSAQRLFGLRLLFEALNDPARARKINDLYGFGHKEFAALTAEDIFGVSLRTSLPAKVAERDQWIADLTAQALTRDQHLEAVKAQLLMSDEQVRGLTSQVAQKDAAVQALTSAVAEKDQAAQALTSQIAERNQTVRMLYAQVIDRQMALRTLWQEIADKEQAIGTLRAREADQRQQLSAIWQSRSWRAVMYLRHFRQLLLPPGSRRLRLVEKLRPVAHFLSETRQNARMRRDLSLIRSSPLFDGNWYLAHYPDVAQAGQDPARHYLLYGGFEGRDPGPDFRTAWYLENNEDVRQAGINPLFHYLSSGKKEGRLPRPYRPGDTPIRPDAAPHSRSWWRIIDNWKSRARLLIRRGTGPGLASGFQVLSRPSGKEPSQLDPGALPHEPSDPAGLHYRPLVSVLIPTHNTPRKYLVAALESVRCQSYPHWEICLCDDASSSQATRDEISRLAESDPRIKTIFLSTNCGTSTATNKAAEIAHGELFAFLDHDDELTQDALYEVVKALNEDDRIEVLYSDQDKIDSRGLAHEPFFKPDWSPVLFRSVMYVGHLLVVKRELFERMNGMNSRFDGVQDYEFMLRVSETAATVKHIPRILYHWREIPGSVALGLDEKGGKIEQLQVRAANEHLARLGLRGVAIQHPKHRHRVLVQPQPREHYPRVSVVILTKDAPQYIERCLHSLLERSTYPNFEVVAVDNGTIDPDALRILNDNPVRVVPFQEKFNYSKANNIGVQQSEGEFIILLNNDTEVLTPDWIEQMLFYCEMPGVGAVGPLLLYPDHTVQHAGVVLGLGGIVDHVMRRFPSDSDGYAGSLSCPREVSAVTGACLMIKRSDYLSMGGLLEYYATHYQDVDLCLQLLAMGKSNIYVPHAVLLHYESATRGRFYDHVDRALLHDRWGHLLVKGDPFYNPNFSLDGSGFYETRY